MKQIFLFAHYQWEALGILSHRGWLLTETWRLCLWKTESAALGFSACNRAALRTAAKESSALQSDLNQLRLKSWSDVRPPLIHTSSSKQAKVMTVYTDWWGGGGVWFVLGTNISLSKLLLERCLSEDGQIKMEKLSLNTGVKESKCLKVLAFSTIYIPDQLAFLWLELEQFKARWRGGCQKNYFYCYRFSSYLWCCRSLLFRPFLFRQYGRHLTWLEYRNTELQMLIVYPIGIKRW